jgi:polyhydroxybutyrate depolymerase
MKRIIGITIIWLAIILAGCQSIPTREYQNPGNYEMSLEVAGVERTFLVHVPPQYIPGTPLPLVFNLHGRTDTAEHQQEMSQMNAKADEAGFIVVAPQADDVPPTWWGAVPGDIGADDMAFFEALLDHLQTEISIDPLRIYATGFSNGASMANRLGCAYPDVFAAVAPVSGGHVGWYECEAQLPVSVIAFHGLDDGIIPYEGNQNNPKVHDWVEAWAARNGCAPSPDVKTPGKNVTQETWGGCRGDTLVTLYSTEAGHSWPGSDFRIDLGGPTQAIDATEVIWEFFAAHPQTDVTLGDNSAEEPPAPTQASVTDSAYPTAGEYFEVIHTGGFERTFKVHIPPSYDTQTPTPLVLSYHGRGSNAFDHAVFSDFSAKADEVGFIVVYPQATGSPTTWQDLPFESEYSDTDVNEVLFASDFLDHLERELNIDPQRIFAVGMSNGGGMTHRLACDLADRFAAIAPVAGAFYLWDDCQPSQPVAVVAFHSMKDNVVPYEGSYNPLFIDVPPIPVWAQAWADLNDCDSTPETNSIDQIINVDTWSNCAGDATVTLYSMLLGGHTWPTDYFGGRDEAPIMINDVIWDFFQAHPKDYVP